MTQIEYELLRAQEPQLELPDWLVMCARSQQDVDYVMHSTREQVIAGRAVILMTRGFGLPHYGGKVPAWLRD